MFSKFMRYSRGIRFFLFGAAIIALGLGIAEFIHALFVPLLRRANEFESLVICFLAIALLFLAFRIRIGAFVPALLAIGAEVFRLKFIIAYMQAEFINKHVLPDWYREALQPYLWINLSVISFAIIAYLAVSLPKLGNIFLWIGGILAGLTVGLLFLQMGIYPAYVVELERWSQIITLSAFDVVALLLVTIGLIFYIGIHIRHSFPIWLAILIALVGIGQTLSSWSAFNVREKHLVYTEEKAQAELAIADFTREVKIYFTALKRLAHRWEREPDNKVQLEKDASAYLEDFSFLRAVVQIDAPGKEFIIARDGFDQWQSLVQNPQSQKLDTKAQELESRILIKENAFWVINSLRSSDGVIYFFTDLERFLDQAVPFALAGRYFLKISEGQKVIYQSEGGGHTEKRLYGIQLNWDLLGYILKVSIWPKNLVRGNLAAWIYSYQIVLGCLLSVFLGVCLYFIFISYKRRKEAENAVLEKNFFFANISHELRTPLHGIVGALSILSGKHWNDGDQKLINGLVQQSQHLQRMIADLITLAHMELTGLETKHEVFDLRDLCQKLCADMQLLAEQKMLSFSFRYQDDLPTHFIGDAFRLKQVLRNLISNALCFTEEGSISFYVTGKGRKGKYNLQFQVTDTGVGIPQAMQKIVFEKYKHMEGRDSQGAGLGLGITKRLVETMDGWVELESEVNVGSKFTVHIKLPTADNARKPE